MPRLIDADDLWSDIMMLPHNGDMISSEEVEQAIKDAPTIDPESLRPKWISVGDRLPEASTGKVLVVKKYRGKRYVDIGEIIEGKAYCDSDEYAIHPREHKLTHWMPLPEPPTTNEVASDVMMQARED